METRNTICFGEKIFIESAQNNVNDQRFCLTEQGSSIRIVLLLPSVELFKMHGVGDHQARTNDHLFKKSRKSSFAQTIVIVPRTEFALRSMSLPARVPIVLKLIVQIG